MNTKKNPQTILEAPDVTAFILTTTGTIPKPILRKSDNKIVFAFDADISESIQKFYSNTQIGILDFCKNLKSIRSMIFNCKAGLK